MLTGKEYRRYTFGDMNAVYYLNAETKSMGLSLLPAHLEPLPWEVKYQNLESLVQVKIVGDAYLGDYAPGRTMYHSQTVEKFGFVYQQVKKSPRDTVQIQTILRDGRGYEIIHVLQYRNGEKAVSCHTEFKNNSCRPIKLELLSSFSIGGITPYIRDPASGQLLIHRIRSVWSMEGRLETRTLEELQLEQAWAGNAVRVLRFGQRGSLPVNDFFPFAAVEDTANDVVWGAQIAHNASWQMEVCRRDAALSVSGGLADREFGHWMKQINAGECFRTPEAILSVCRGGGVNGMAQRLTDWMNRYVDQKTGSEKDLPIIFNEYCTTWGNPSEKNIDEIVNAIRGHGCRYFVIDCGWYKEEGVPWNRSMGDYQSSKELFPRGLYAAAEKIKKADMEPGLWFEINNVGDLSRAYQQEEHLLHRDGMVLTTTRRRFWNMCDSWVENYLNQKVIGTLADNGFTYLKMDDNDSIGIGCDDRDSLGEGLRKNMAAFEKFIRKIKKEIPGIVIENCASGGHKLEPLTMSLSSLASFSDAHECEEIPVIAANMHRMILPRQNLIWAVVRKTDNLQRIAYTIASTFLGRICLSGDVLDLSNEQWHMIDRGIAFYRNIVPVILHGTTYWFGTPITSYRKLTGWQGILRLGETAAYAVFHIFHDCCLKEINIPLPENRTYRIVLVYSSGRPEVFLKEGCLCFCVRAEMEAVAVFLQEESV